MEYRILNTAKDWNSLKKSVEKQILDKNFNELKVTVEVSSDPASKLSDVVRLQNFLTIVDAVRKYNYNLKSEGKQEHFIPRLIVTVSKGENISKEEREYHYREKINQIAQFFSVQAMFRSGLRIFIKDYELGAERTSQQEAAEIEWQEALNAEKSDDIGRMIGAYIRYGRVIPVVTVNNIVDSALYYKRLVNTEIDYGGLDGLREFCSIYNEETALAKLIMTNEYKRMIRETPYISKDFLDYINEADLKKPLKLKRMFALSRKDKVDIIYVKFLLANITYAAISIKGTQEHPIKAENKREIIEHIFGFLHGKLESLPVLAQYLWSVFVRYLVEDRFLYRYDEKEKKYIWSSGLLEKALMDALNYAEGMYQLIENSCLYSQGKCAHYSLRLYDTNTEIRKSKLSGVVQTVKHLSDRYDNLMSFDSARKYMEITITDSTFTSRSQGFECDYSGMISHYNKNLKKGETIGSLRELYNLYPKELDDILFHHGLRTFKKILKQNQGCFIISTSDDDRCYYIRPVNGGYEEGSQEKIDDSEFWLSGESRYKMIAPVYEEWRDEAGEIGITSENHFNREYLDVDYIPKIISLNELRCAQPNEDKEVLVEKVYMEMEKGWGDKKNRILCINASGLPHYHVELLAKVMMKYSLKNNEDDNKLAVLFTNRNYIYEFVRIYSTFYEITEKNVANEQFHIKNTQIALCSMRKTENMQIPEVNFILNTNDIRSAQYTARLYAYYDSDATMEFVPLIDYLTGGIDENAYRIDSSQKLDTAPFPFDLCFDFKSFEEDYNSDKDCLDEDRIWFFRHITEVLNTDIQKEPYGCKVDGVHVSIGSKIHISSYYNAELLFHNYGNVTRFAYLVAKDISKAHERSKKKILLIAYESYSSVLIQKVRDMVEEKTGKETSFLIFNSDKDENDDVKSGGLWPAFSAFLEENSDINEYQAFVVIPVGTTLSTIYKIQNIANRLCERKYTQENGRKKRQNKKHVLSFGKSIVLIVVGGADDNSSTGYQGIKLGYWKEVDKTSKEIELEREMNGHDGLSSQAVRYYFNPLGEWHDTIECDEDDEYDACLIGVDKTDTLLNVIFEQEKSSREVFKEKRHNFSKVKKLRGHINYAHISNAGNHHQYHIAYEDFFIKEEREGKIRKWLENEVNCRIDQSAFNIIVSPLDNANSLFLKSVVEYAFGGNARIFNIQINTYFKEDVRTKFSYIAREYEKTKKLFGKIQVNVYYVNNCIVSGRTLQRGKQFMHMLLHEFGMTSKSVNLYKGIILLINRSSYDTIQSYLPGHVKEDFHAYMDLNVPSYNTMNGVCPGCELVDIYATMHRRSSTYGIAEEYERLKEKHICKDLNTYEQWLAENIYQQKSYATWMMQWIYYHSDKKENNPRGGKRKYVNLFGETEIIKIPAALDTIMSSLRSQNEIGTFQDNEDACRQKEAMIEFVKETVIKDKNYMRLACAHEVYTETQEIMIGIENKAEAVNKAREIVIRIIKSKLDDIEELHEKGKITFHFASWLKSEWIMSYVKVISRKQIAKYYHIRSAIYDILKDMIRALTDETYEVSSDLQWFIELYSVNTNDKAECGVLPDLKFKMFMLVLRRLSAMHSSFVINKTDVICDYYKRCCEQYEGQGAYSSFYETWDEANKDNYMHHIRLPKEKAFSFNIIKLIKWAAMSHYDDSKCFVIEKAYCDRLSGDRPVDQIAQMAFLENTQVIYQGLKRLLERYNNDELEKKSVRCFIDEQYDGAKVVLPEGEVSYLKMNVNRYFFEFMDKRKYREEQMDDDMRNKFAYMVMFFHDLKKLAKQKTVVDTPYPYEVICNYMRDICEYEYCSLIHHDGKVYQLATSSIHEAYFENDLTKREISKLIDCFITNEDGLMSSVMQKYYLKREENTTDLSDKSKLATHKIMILYLPIYKSKKNGVYVLLCKRLTKEFDIKEGEPEHCNKLDYEDLWNIRNVLFLRDRLDTAILRDIDVLKNMIHRYDYIEPIVPEKKNEHFLHITDLHISDKKKETLVSILEKDRLPEKPNLLLITGDVVRGEHSAMALVKNYKAAEKILRKIVIKLWSEEIDGIRYVRSDWKKRVLISTGNHDYASMNELKAQHEHRTALSGTANTEMGDTMVKHSYFINFLHSFLGMDIDDAVEYDLNEIVNFDRMKTSVVNLNSNSGVSPYRTNKVRIDKAAVENMSKALDLLDNVIFMTHHTPMYRIDYVTDTYHLKQKILKKEFKSSYLPDKFDAREIWILLIKGVIGRDEESIMELEKKMPENARGSKDINDVCEELMKSILGHIYGEDKAWFKDMHLYDFEYFLEVPEERRKTEDKCRQISSKLQEYMNASLADQEAYIGFVCDFFGEIDKTYCILGGHTHRAVTFEGTEAAPFRNCEGIIEAPEFFKITNENKKEGKLQYTDVVNKKSTSSRSMSDGTDIWEFKHHVQGARKKKVKTVTENFFPIEEIIKSMRKKVSETENQ